MKRFEWKKNSLNSFDFILWLNKDGGTSVFWRPGIFTLLTYNHRDIRTPRETCDFEYFLKLIWSYDFNFRFVFCCYKKNYGGKFSAEKVEYICFSIHNILCDLLLTVVHISSTLINIKSKLCFINMINTSYCGKSHWNDVKSSLLTKF